MDKLLELLGIKDYDDLHLDEQVEYRKMVELAEQSKVTLDSVKQHIIQMRIAVEVSLVNEKLSPTEDLFLKARLKNYIFFENLFMRPEKARQMLEQITKTKLR